MEPQKGAAEPPPTPAEGDAGKQEDQDFRASLRAKPSDGRRRSAQPRPAGAAGRRGATLSAGRRCAADAGDAAAVPAAAAWRRPRCCSPTRKRAGTRRGYHKLLAPPPPASRSCGRPPRTPATPAEPPHADATWADVPDEWNTGRKLKALQKAFAEFLYNNARVAVSREQGLEARRPARRGRGGVPPPLPGRGAAAGGRRGPRSWTRSTGRSSRSSRGPPRRPRRPKEPTWLERMLPKFMQPETITFGPAMKAGDAEKLRKLEAEYQAKRVAIYEEWKKSCAKRSRTCCSHRTERRDDLALWPGVGTVLALAGRRVAGGVPLKRTYTESQRTQRRQRQRIAQMCFLCRCLLCVLCDSVVDPSTPRRAVRTCRRAGGRPRPGRSGSSISS